MNISERLKMVRLVVLVVTMSEWQKITTKMGCISLHDTSRRDAGMCEGAMHKVSFPFMGCTLLPSTHLSIRYSHNQSINHLYTECNDTY